MDPDLEQQIRAFAMGRIGLGAAALIAPKAVLRRWLGRGSDTPVTRVLARFVLHPTPDRGASLEQRIAAIAIADQVGLALAAPQPGREIRHG